ncbi:MAG TPA: DNA polymerase Y family protein, partial [Candidatus Limnocylindrales bacterium]|nr:DNA polymerase Y family protein [Candidatus Limnocylindrales bacterium]
DGAGTRELVVTPSEGAARAGILPGMTVSAAHALIPARSVFRRDEPSEAAAMARLAAWAGRFTPVVSLAPPREVMMEVAGSLKLFGGLDRLAGQVGEGVRKLGYTAQIALAPTPLGAALLARARPGTCVTGLERLEAELLTVPVDALDLAPETLEALRDLGVATLRDCLVLPRPGLARRFGEELLRDLDRALGKRPDPRDPFAPPHRFEGRLPLPVEASAAEPLLFAIRRLLLELEGYLEACGGGAAELRLTLSHRGGRRTRIGMRLASPSRDPRRLLGLLRERLGRTRMPEPVSAVELSVETVLPLSPANRELFRKPAQRAGEAWPELLERLRARLGPAAVLGFRPAAEHRPERAFVETEPGTGEEPASSIRFGRRPVWLLRKPAPVERKELTLLSGPERIEAGWWDGQDVRRDYFVATDPRGATLWVFRERSGKRQWYLHGIFG